MCETILWLLKNIYEIDKEFGIYRWSRNPAFLGFDFMYIGVCLLFCNPLTIAFSIFAIVMLHLQILQEGKYLTAAFGKPYIEYKAQVFRYQGRSKKNRI